MTRKVFIFIYTSFLYFNLQTNKFWRNDNLYIYIEEGESANEKDRSYGSMMMERLTGSPDGRIDHVLQVIKFLLYFGVLQHTGNWDTPFHNPTL
jgi:hypothetical protein